MSPKSYWVFLVLTQVGKAVWFTTSCKNVMEQPLTNFFPIKEFDMSSKLLHNLVYSHFAFLQAFVKVLGSFPA